MHNYILNEGSAFCRPLSFKYDIGLTHKYKLVRQIFGSAARRSHLQIRLVNHQQPIFFVRRFQAFYALRLEYPDQPGVVGMRPISEQTGQPTTSWELSFRSRTQT